MRTTASLSMTADRHAVMAMTPLRNLLLPSKRLIRKSTTISKNPQYWREAVSIIIPANCRITSKLM